MPELPSVSGAVLYSPKYTGIISMTGFLFGYLEDMGRAWRPGYRLHTPWLPSLMLLTNWLGGFRRCAPISYSLHGPRPRRYPHHLPSDVISSQPCHRMLPAVHSRDECDHGSLPFDLGTRSSDFCHPMAEGSRCWMGCLAWPLSSALGSFMLPVLLMWKEGTWDSEQSIEFPKCHHFLDTV